MFKKQFGFSFLKFINMQIIFEIFVLNLINFRKIFDATSGPFPFLPQKLYHFASKRFIDSHVSVQDQVLSWLKVNQMFSN